MMLQKGSGLKYLLVVISILILAVAVAIEPIATVVGILGIGYVILALFYPYLAIYFLVFLIPLVDLLSYKILPTEYLVISKMVSEIAVMILFLSVLGHHLLERKKFSFPREIWWLAVFIIMSIISTLINQVDLEHFAFGITVIIRYILLYLTILMLSWPKQRLRQLYLCLILVTGIQLLISFGQFMLGDWFRNFFIFDTKHTFSTSTIYTLERQTLDTAWLFGTFSRYNLLGGFLMLMFVLVLCGYFELIPGIRKYLLGLLLLVLTMAIILTNSRNSWLGVFIAASTVMWIQKRRQLLIMFLAGIGITGILLITLIPPVSLNISETMGAAPVERFLGLFSGEYIHKSMQNDRLFLITKASKQVITEAPWWGVGMGSSWSAQEAAFGDVKYSMLLGLPVESWYYLGDVGWIALFTQIGLLGLAPFIIFLVMMFYRSLLVLSRLKAIEKIFTISFMAMWVAMMVTNIWAFNFTYRATSFYFWLIAGVTSSIAVRQKGENR